MNPVLHLPITDTLGRLLLHCMVFQVAFVWLYDYSSCFKVDFIDISIDSS